MRSEVLVFGTDFCLNSPEDNFLLIFLSILYMSAKQFFTIQGENLLHKIKELVEEGNIRRITISDKAGKEIMSFPLTVGVVGAVFAPVLAAVGALAALIGECTIAVEREEETA